MLFTAGLNAVRLLQTRKYYKGTMRGRNGAIRAECVSLRSVAPFCLDTTRRIFVNSANVKDLSKDWLDGDGANLSCVVSMSEDFFYLEKR
jgi:hypothetical protein